MYFHHADSDQTYSLDAHDSKPELVLGDPDAGDDISVPQYGWQQHWMTLQPNESCHVTIDNGIGEYLQKIAVQNNDAHFAFTSQLMYHTGHPTDLDDKQVLIPRELLPLLIEEMAVFGLHLPPLPTIPISYADRSQDLQTLLHGPR